MEMNIYKKFAALALAGVMTLGLMAGCTTGGEETTPPTDTTTAPTAEGTDAATEPSSGETTEPAAGTLTSDITVISREEGSGTRGAFVEIMGVVDADEVDATEIGRAHV